MIRLLGMNGEDTAPPLSKDAAAVLEKMRVGLVLVGNVGDYGRDFRLMVKGAATWVNVNFAIVEELLVTGRIRRAENVGPFIVPAFCACAQTASRYTNAESLAPYI